MTGLEQHAATVRAKLLRWADARDRRNPFGHGKTGTQLLRDAAALAGRADELEAAGEAGLLVPLDASAVRLKAAEARADELATELATAKTTMKAAIWDMEAAEARADELQRELDEAREEYHRRSTRATSAALQYQDEAEQARREADQLRAALREIKSLPTPALQGGRRFFDEARNIARAALAGVQADSKDSA